MGVRRRRTCLCQVFHVGWFDVHYVEALIGVVKMPQVYSQVITGDERFLITTYGDSVDVVCVGIAKHTLTPCLHDLFNSCDLQAGAQSACHMTYSKLQHSVACKDVPSNIFVPDR